MRVPSKCYSTDYKRDKKRSENTVGNPSGNCNPLSGVAVEGFDDCELEDNQGDCHCGK